MTSHASRRDALKLGFGLGVTFFAAPALAADPKSPKLVVIVCRGAMDGLSVSPPLNDADYLSLRSALSAVMAIGLRKAR